jgi:Flp pilus assembly protein TadG
MLKAFKKLWNNDRGNILIIGGAALPMLVGAAGLATDTIQWALWKRQIQRAADSAAIAGVYDRALSAGATTGTETAITRDLTLNQQTGIALQPGYPVVAYPADTATNKMQVSVTLAVRKELSFSSLFLDTPPLIRASATAASIPGHDSYCLVSLENTTATGIEGSGNSNVNFSCGMITNSVATNAAIAKGSSVMHATVIAAAGGIQESNNWQVDKYDPFVPAQDDPFKDLVPDDTDKAGCTNTPLAQITGSNGAGSNWTPGCYASINIGSNKMATLAAGTYYINGGGVNIQGTLVAHNVTIILSNTSTANTATIGSFDMNASGVLDMTAPTSGKWKGMAIYQDRRAQNSGGSLASAPNKINGNSSNTVQGALYFPNQAVAYNGTGTSGFSCTQFVVRRIIFTGNNATQNKFTDDCEAFGMTKIEGGRLVRLVA